MSFCPSTFWQLWQYIIRSRAPPPPGFRPASSTRCTHGTLAPGDSLPPVRQLAGELGVSPATVAAAYRQLRERGVVETAGRNGTRVRPRPPVAPAARRPPAGAAPGLVDLSAGEPDTELLPAPGPRAARGRRRAPPPPATSTAPLPELLAAARERLGRRCRPSTSPSPPARSTASSACSPPTSRRRQGGRRGSRLGEPARPGRRAGAAPGAGRGRRRRARAGRACAAALSRGAKAVIVTSRAQNPTGAALTRRRARRDPAGARAVPAGPGRSRTTTPPSWPTTNCTRSPAPPAAGRSCAPRRSRTGPTCGWPSSPATRPPSPGWRAGCGSAPAGSPRSCSGSSWSCGRIPRRPRAIARQGKNTTSGGARLPARSRARGVTAHGRSGINVWVPVADETFAVTRLRDAGYAVAPGSAVPDRGAAGRPGQHGSAASGRCPNRWSRRSSVPCARPSGFARPV